MQEFIETFKTYLTTWGELVEVILNTISLLCIVVGVIMSFVRSAQDRQRNPGLHPLHTFFRRMFGGWLVVALEFQLAADIVGTIIAPTTAQLIELGVVAVIRTFLNYFLGKELKEEDDLLRSRTKIKRTVATE